VHDYPDGLMTGICRSFKDDGTYLAHEVNVSDKVRENLTPDGQPRESLVGLDPAPSAKRVRGLCLSCECSETGAACRGSQVVTPAPARVSEFCDRSYEADLSCREKIIPPSSSGASPTVPLDFTDAFESCPRVRNLTRSTIQSVCFRTFRRIARNPRVCVRSVCT
jgi:hypothetical protein